MTLPISPKIFFRSLRFPLFLFVALWISIGRSEDLQIFTTEVPPLIFKKDDQLTGFCIDLVNELQRRIGDHTPIHMVPWARALLIGQTQSNVILVCPKRTAEREKMFKWVGPVFESSTSLYMKRGSKLRIQTLEDAKQKIGILVPRASYVHQELLNLGFTKLTVTDTSLTAIEMLLRDRQPLVALEEVQMPALLKSLKKDLNEVQIAYKLAPTHSYLSFSKQLPDKIIRQWQKTLDQMKKDGTYQTIHRKWFQ